MASHRLIETDRFPVEFISLLAERESWRKEVHRPIYHVHKWWAKRLGSVFRGALLGCLLPEDARLEDAFYARHDFSGVSVFEPFMGSGTTIGEAHKLGCTALGRDINPVACEAVRVAFGPMERRRLQGAYEQLSASVGERIRTLYRTTDAQGEPAEVLYYFWVKTVPCPQCHESVELFSSRIFARNAYPDRKPEVQVCCPTCGGIQAGRGDDASVHCKECAHEFAPNAGPARGAKADCPHCRHTFAIAVAIRAVGTPPAHRLYAKLVLTDSGDKQYLRATDEDFAAYTSASVRLSEEVAAGRIRLPVGELANGYNTRQAIGYGYRAWRDFFNDRQLLALGWLQEAIAALPDESTRDALLMLFSGVLEFNNLFASYKGEGTGAVRHMFSHHILKPERTPIEANVWGTPKSSGSFSNLFRGRLLRALEYRAAPREVTLGEGRSEAISSAAFAGEATTAFPTDGRFAPRGIYLSCGSSDSTGLPAASVDFVVTDPPFFDNVHYSELADFFHAWQVLHPRGFIADAATTRNAREVQDTDADSFAAKLAAVFSECHRVLKDDGLLVFSYHHSRPDGWASLAEAILDAGFSVVEAHPVRAEMSVATPKAQASEPIQLDVLLVCRKRDADCRPVQTPPDAWIYAEGVAHERCARLTAAGFTLSRHDRRVVRGAHFLVGLGPVAGMMASDWKAAFISLSSDAEPTTESAVAATAKVTVAPLQRHLELFA
jgi:putative DNA methylase